MYRNNLCETCLSLGRKMCEINDDQLQSICPGFQLSVTNSRVCWECCNMVRKWIKFRDKVVKAQETLADYTIQNSTSLSTLRIKRQAPISINCTNTSNMNVAILSDVEVKYEHVCKDETEVPMDDSIDFEDPINDNTEDHPTPPTKYNLTPVRVYVKENTHAKHNTNHTANPVKSCMKTTNSVKKKTKQEKRVAFNNSDEDTETADEFEDEKIKTDAKSIETFKVVRVEKHKLLKVLNRSRSKRWFFQSKQPKCASCIMLFKNEESYKQHLKKHDVSSGPHACEVCQQRFTTMERVRTHEETHLNKCIECVECHELFGSPLDFSAHYKDRHSHRNIVCWKCIKMFPTVREYRQHRNHEHRPLCTCEHCGKKFNKSSLKMHIKFMHTQIERTECPVCFKMIKGDMKYLQQTHMKKVHGPKLVDEDSFCVECNIQFRTVWSYRSHVKIKHENVKSECPQCGKLYLYLSSHMQTHSNEMKYSCPECNKKFKWASALRNHVKYRHRGVPKPRTKTCNVCQKSFGSNRELQDHTHTHTGERPYVCATCGDTFGHKASLFTHNKLKHRRNTQCK